MGSALRRPLLSPQEERSSGTRTRAGAPAPHAASANGPAGPGQQRGLAASGGGGTRDSSEGSAGWRPPPSKSRTRTLHVHRQFHSQCAQGARRGQLCARARPPEMSADLLLNAQAAAAGLQDG